LALGLQHKPVESVEVKSTTSVHTQQYKLYYSPPSQTHTHTHTHTHTQTHDVMQKEMKLPSSQILGLFHRLVRKFVQLFSQLEEGEAGAGLATPTDVDLQPIAESVDSELVCGGVVPPLDSLQGEGERKNHTSLYLVT